MSPIQHLREIGIFGSVLMSLVVLLISVKWIKVICRSRQSAKLFVESNTSLIKKHGFYLFLLLAALLDLPMYIGFAVYNKYYLAVYSFHKLAPSAMLAALSITISNWRKVLFDLHEFAYYPNLLGAASLIAANVIVGIFSIINFVLCFSTGSFKSFIHAKPYIILCFIMIIVPLLLIMLMLRAGIALSFKLQKAVINQEYELFQETSCDVRKSFTPPTNLQQSIRRLNMVMATCALAIVIQTVFTALNVASGYYKDMDSTYGPDVAYFFFVDMLPTVMVSLALLYLSRSGKNSKISWAEVKWSSASAVESVDSTEISTAEGTIYSQLIENIDEMSASDSVSDISDADASPAARGSRESVVSRLGTPASNKIPISPIRPNIQTLEERFMQYRIQPTLPSPSHGTEWEAFGNEANTRLLGHSRSLIHEN